MSAAVRVLEAVRTDAAASPAAGRLAIVMPARDEAAAVAAVIASVRRCLPGVPVIVVDDASGDATAAVAEAAGARVLRLPVPLGAWGAAQTGMRYALRLGCDTVITMDADGQHRAEELPKLLRTWRDSGADVVIGAYPERGSRLRRLAWRLFRLLSGFSFADLTSGFRLYDHAALCLLASPRATLLEYQDVGVLLLLRTQGLTIAETPVTMRARLEGRSRVFASWWRVGRYMVQTVFLCLAKRSLTGRRRKRR